ncbi:MAG: gliding motility-associated C-terminal domain-containing protein [Flavobacteriales bacterium]|jgi:gliding motility-associated-like protein|nr:gliding motility-associated C-terminal domain-containing protein [Flavobacteriales bacterium]
MRHHTLPRIAALSTLAFALSALAQNGNDAHPSLIRVEADRQVLGAETMVEVGSNAEVDDLGVLPALPMKPVGLLAATAFTPDGDGLNDKYFPYMMGMELGLSRFQVFDRWGRQLYSTTSGEGWDGTFGTAGAAMPLGVYVWHLEAWPAGSRDKVEISGSVTLIR